MTRSLRITAIAVAGALVLVVPNTAAAYVGPGAGLTIIGAALAFVGGVVLAILGFLWYPIKRLLNHFRAKRPAVVEQAEE